MQILSKMDDEIKAKFCCKKTCFASLDITFLREKMLQILQAKLTERRATINSMATSNGNFVFDGKEVCSEFLRKAFRFSLEVQAEARRLFKLDLFRDKMHGRINPIWDFYRQDIFKWIQFYICHQFRVASNF